MAKCQQPLFKDFIYNKYVVTINQCIQKSNECTTETLEPLQPRENKCYSLVEFSAFTLFNIPAAHENAKYFQEVLDDDNEDIQKLIADARILKEMEM